MPENKDINKQMHEDIMVLEEAVKNYLINNFPNDTISVIVKRASGEDILQEIFSKEENSSKHSIYWQTKETKALNKAWIKILKDQQSAKELKADEIVIVSHTMPKEIECFAKVDGIWICSSEYFHEFANMLRNQLLGASNDLMGNANLTLDELNTESPLEKQKIENEIREYIKNHHQEMLMKLRLKKEELEKELEDIKKRVDELSRHIKEDKK